MAESRLITDTFEKDYLNLWHMISTCCEIDRHNGAPPGNPDASAEMIKEIRGFDQQGGPDYTARVTAAALAFGEEEIRAIEEGLADVRAAVALLRQPRAYFTRNALRLVSSNT